MKAYQFKISIVGSHPPIWRRCLVPVWLSFGQLGEAIQIMMGWSGAHLSSFRLPTAKREIDLCNELTGEISNKAMTAILADELVQEKWFEYTYDYGDDWRHRIQLEAVVGDYDKNYPQLVKAKGSNPVEDCGGVHALQTLSEEDRQPYDIAAVNEKLREKRFHQDAVNVQKATETTPAMGGLPVELQEFMQAPEFKRLPKKSREKFMAILETVMDQVDEDDDPDFADIMATVDDKIESCPDRSMPFIKVVPCQLQELLNNTSRKADLIAMAHHKGLRIKQTLRKAEITEALAQAMLEPGLMRRHLLWLPAGEMYYLLTDLGIADTKWMKPYLHEGILENCTMRACFTSGYGSYGGYNEFGGMIIAEDVAVLLQKILTEEFLQQYHQYWWLNQVLQIADVLYVLIPKDILQQLLAKWSGFKLTEQEVLAAIETRPAELVQIETSTEYIVSEPVPTGAEAQLFIRRPGDTYFLPTEQQIWMNDVLMPPVKALIQQANRQFTRDWEGNEDGSMLELLTSCIPGLISDMSAREIEMVFRKEFADQPDLNLLWSVIRSYLRRMEPYIRKTTNHGFTDAEKKEQQQAVQKERKRAQKNKDTGNNVISLDMHRRKRKNKKNKRK